METQLHHSCAHSVKSCRERANSLILNGTDHILAKHLLAWCEVAEGKVPYALFQELKEPCLERRKVPPAAHLGWLMSACGLTHEGLNRLHEDLELDPDNPQLRLLAGICLLRARDYRAAQRVLGLLVEEFPDLALANGYHGMALLSLGRWTEGFQSLRRGWSPGELEKDFLTEPDKLWTGQNVRNKNVVLVGSGVASDYFIYLRYLPLLRELNGQNPVGLVCDSESMVPLFRSIRTVSRVDTKKFDRFDYFIPLTQLPMVLGARPDSVPAPVNPFHLSQQHIQEKRRRLRYNQPLLGLHWRGTPHRGVALENAIVPASLTARELSEMLSHLSSRYQIISFQEDLTPEEEMLLSAHSVYCPPQRDLTDFRSMAEWLSMLDLMVSVDSAPGHLAALLGIECHFMLGYSPAWIWNTKNPNEQGTSGQRTLFTDPCSWYPDAVLYRQRSENRWLECLVNLFQNLERRKTFPELVLQAG